MIRFPSEEERLRAFPVARTRIFLSHAGVTALPSCAADAMRAHIAMSCEHHQETGEILRGVGKTRHVCADLIGAHSDEIALLGPTSLGLSLFANGLDWHEGDELVCYRDDYPANVYPWTNLDRQGVRVRFIEPDVPGRITPDLVESSLTPRTRMVALASCHFLTGWRIDIDAIGSLLQSRGILFSLDAIQTLGAFPTRVTHVDFLSADAHKWMLGPLAIGIVFVARRNFDRCRPTLLGAWNVISPNFQTQSEITFPDSAQRYEPGVLNITGMYGMRASLEMLLGHGIDAVASRILAIRDHLHSALESLGFEFLSPPPSEPLRSGIVTARHPETPADALFRALEAARVTAPLRTGRDGRLWLRFSPHFYNTEAEIDRVIETLRSAIR
jgi:cysteine desulfurase/selenocysteine lyase